MGRYIKPNHSNRIPAFTAAVHCSYSEVHNPDLPVEQWETMQAFSLRWARRERGQWTRQDSMAGTNRRQFKEWLFNRISHTRPLWLVADDAGRVARWLGIFEMIDKRELNFDEDEDEDDDEQPRRKKKKRRYKGTVCIEDPPVILRLWCPEGRITIVDRKNYFPGSLDAIFASQQVKRPRQPQGNHGQQVHDHYAAVHCETVWKWWTSTLDAWERQDSGCWAPTSAALAWNAWRHSLPAKTFVIDRHDERDLLERAAYYGGHAYAGYIGRCTPTGEPSSVKPRRSGTLDDEPPRGPFYHLDVSSFYPSVMRGNLFPSCPQRNVWQSSRADYDAFRRFFLCLACVRVKSNERVYPRRVKGAVHWCHGEFWTVLAGPELDAAVEAGDVVEWGALATYQSAYLFDKFVDDWYGRRLKAQESNDVAAAALAKMVLNGLSGKFAQRGPRWAECKQTIAQVRWGQWTQIPPGEVGYVVYRALGGRVERQIVQEEGRYAFPAVSAFITSYARVKLNAICALCPARSILYRDADALILTQPGWEAIADNGLVCDGTLGGLRLVATYDSLTLHNVRDYVADGRDVISGVSADAKRLGGATFEQSVYSRLADALCF